MPEVAVVVYGHPADVHSDVFRVKGNKGFFAAGESVVNGQFGHGLGLYRNGKREKAACLGWGSLNGGGTGCLCGNYSGLK